MYKFRWFAFFQKTKIKNQILIKLFLYVLASEQSKALCLLSLTISHLSLTLDLQNLVLVVPDDVPNPPRNRLGYYG